MSLKRIPDQPGFVIRRLQQVAVASFHDTLAVARITPIQYTILQVLIHNQELEQTAIALLAHIDASTTGDVIKRLEKRGLVSRAVNMRDRRSRVVSITDSGRALLEQIQDNIDSSKNFLLHPLDKEEQKLLMDLMLKVVLFHENRKNGQRKEADAQPDTV